jgi:excisionase family DNA binding protein
VNEEVMAMKNDERVEPILLRVDEVARVLGVARSTVYVLIAGGELPVVRFGRATRVPRAAVLAWVEAHTEQTATAEKVVFGPWAA